MAPEGDSFGGGGGCGWCSFVNAKNLSSRSVVIVMIMIIIIIVDVHVRKGVPFHCSIVYVFVCGQIYNCALLLLLLFLVYIHIEGT